MKHFLRIGERLEALSARYKVPVCMIVRANDKIEYKSEIEIPDVSYCSGCAKKQFKRFEMYTVGSESAQQIARRHGITVSELIAMNAMSGESEITTGAVICVPRD